MKLVKLIIRLLSWPFLVLILLVVGALYIVGEAWDIPDLASAKDVEEVWYVVRHLKRKEQPNE